HQIARSQPARLQTEPVDPFQTSPANPLRRTRMVTGHEIEQRADGDAQGAACRIEMLSQPKFLRWISQSHQQQVSPQRPDRAKQFGRMDIAIPVSNAYHLVLRISFGYDGRGAL